MGRQFINVVPETIKKTGTNPLTASNMSRPSGLIANKGLELLTFGTPNGHKASIILEELKEAYGKPDYVFQSISIMENIQKEKWFTDLCPNGRIPVLVDHDNGKLPIMEGAAILSYLTRKYDPEHKLSFANDPELSECAQWVAWQHGTYAGPGKPLLPPCKGAHPLPDAALRRRDRATLRYPRCPPRRPRLPSRQQVQHRGH